MRVLIVGVILVSAFAFASETTKGAKKDYENFKTEMNKQLDSVANQIEELRIKAKQKGSAAQEEAAADLEKSRAKLKSDLSEAKANSKSNWSSFKDSFAKSVDKLNSKIQKAVKD